MQVQVKDPMYILYVHDMDRAVAFYQQAFELAILQHTPGWSMLRCAGSTIALHILSPNSSEEISTHAGFSLNVDDLDQAIQAVVDGGGQHIITRETTNFVPVRMCEDYDTEGNGFELRQFVSEEEDFSAIT